MDVFEIEERNDFEPICPYCNKPLDRIIARRANSTLLNKRLIHCCPHCRKVLGVTDRKKHWLQG